jgi:hypothetical protein
MPRISCSAIVERPPATPHNPPEFRQLRDTVALLEANAKHQTRLVNQLHGLLARVFPELAVHVKNLPKQGTEMRMSRKGNDLVRRLLYTAAQCAIIWNPPVKALFARLRAEGKDYNVALGHCMAKLLRQAFAVWKNKPAVEPPGKVVTATDPSIPSSATNNKLPPLDFAKLRQQVPILQVLEQISWHPVATRGAQWRGACPVHEKPGTKSRSFAVHTEKNLYCCHRCGTRGNALDLWTALREQPFLEAAWDLVETLGLDPPLL